MTEVYSDVIQFRGTHADFGYFQGEKLLSSPLLLNRKKQWVPRKEKHFTINPETFTELSTPMALGVLDEIRGLAKALEMEWEEAIQLFSGYYLEYERSGCSVYADREYLVRNYDSH